MLQNRRGILFEPSLQVAGFFSNLAVKLRLKPTSNSEESVCGESSLGGRSCGRS
jgi:hypothetical protein